MVSRQSEHMIPLLTNESNLIELSLMDRQLCEIDLKQTLPTSKYTPSEIAQGEGRFIGLYFG